MEDKFWEALGTKAQLFPGKWGGKLVIHFHPEEESQGLYGRIVEQRQL